MCVDIHIVEETQPGGFHEETDDPAFWCTVWSGGKVSSSTPALKSWIAQKKSILWIQLIPHKWVFLSNNMKLQKKLPGRFGKIWKNVIPFKFLEIVFFVCYISKEYYFYLYLPSRWIDEWAVLDWKLGKKIQSQCMHC